MRFGSSLVLSAALMGCVLAQPNVRGAKRDAEVNFNGGIVLDDVPATGAAPVVAPKAPAATAPDATAPAATTPATDDKWYIVDKVKGLHPKNARFKDDKNFVLLVKPDEEAVRVRSKAYYKGGKFEFKVRSAAAAPGIITSVYLASGLGRKSDQETGKQDEIDLEWKGNNGTFVQSNVFLTGQEDLKLIDLKIPSNATMRLYGMEWNDQAVNFYIDGQLMRTKPLDRPLKPMQLQMSVWTTMGGWPGLIQWAGPMYWNATTIKSANATFEMISFPDEATDVPKDLDDGSADAAPDDTTTTTKPDDAAATKPAPKADGTDDATVTPKPKPKPTASDPDGVATDIDQDTTTKPDAGAPAPDATPAAAAPADNTPAAPADDTKPTKKGKAT